MMRSPVLFLVFNRPTPTAKVFEAIRAARPPRLYIAADGPRAHREGEAARCAEVRDIVMRVDWPCEVRTLFRDENLGCKAAVSGGISWFFEQEEQGIILEDDCLPHPDFFSYCDTLLERYRDDERVWVVTGDNFQRGTRRGDASYYFSKYNHVWGWASWRRAWQHYQGDIRFWPEWRRSADWSEHAADPVERRYWTRIFDRIHRNEIDTWDYPWTASIWYHGGLTATPNVNLVTNIGFGPDATHTTSGAENHIIAATPLGTIVHPASVVRDEDADKYVFETAFGGRNLRWPRRGVALAKSATRRLRGLMGLGA
ncbi:MAG: hemolytic protein HlpA-like protein [Gammaproteobacteria bacterium HGW-Gammaproteobacteria-1]|jgi:hypothetical protein|nr:MAG: hemolytic protein HlpA-like protein [Gammaproteobacteria bacterium HGW-Gammaproteobacteria-1]